MAEEERKKDAEGNGESKKVDEKEEVGMLLEEMSMLDFDMLCATVASQTHGFGRSKGGAGDDEDECGEVGGVQRMWEGGVLDCFEDHRIAIESACCPCYRFGKNMARANLGPCFIQGTIYVILVVAALFSFIAFGVTELHCFLYLGIAFIISTGTYLGYFRTRIRKQFNIRGSTTSFGDCMNHLFCHCCTLCQEARTLEMNNVQGGVWRGRGDTICIGSLGEGSKPFSQLNQPSLPPTKYPNVCSMERSRDESGHSWNASATQSEPLVSSPSTEAHT